MVEREKRERERERGEGDYTTSSNLIITASIPFDPLERT